MGYLLYTAWVLCVLGIAMVYLAWRGRKLRGLGSGETVALDDVTLFSPKLQLVGRPDRIVKTGKTMIPEEWKSAKRINHGHKLQLTVYLVLIEAIYGERPTHGFVVLGDGKRVRVDYDEKLIDEVFTIAKAIRDRRKIIHVEVPVTQPAWKCRVCGQRENCSQRSA